MAVGDQVFGTAGSVNGTGPPGAGIYGGLSGADLSKIALNGQQLLVQMGNLINALTNILPFSGAFGSFTCGAAATTTVTNSSVAINSVIFLMPTNAAAGTLMGSAKSLYVSARTAGTSFAVTTASAAAAAGTETFQFLVVNPS